MAAKTFPKGTNVREVTGWDRSTKAVFECKEHPGIHYASKQPSCSAWFPANEEALDIDRGYKADPCAHTSSSDVWVLAHDYQAEDGAGL